MNTMVTDNGLTFKDFEKKTFEMLCKYGQEYTRQFLEGYDTYLMENRDKAAYRNKGLRKTTIKTVYGEVEYERRVYETTREDGLKDYVFLLDEQLEIAGVGLISMNMTEQMISGITEMSYRECAAKVTEMTGQRISAMGVWNVVQALGEKVCEEEKELVKAHKAGKVCGEKEIPVLFEEADGIYLSLQREKQASAEMKVGIAYDGWKETGRDRYALNGKVVVAGFADAKEFQQCREAAIAEKYNLDETEIRIMNADGAEWIKNMCEAETVFQLDPYHRNKAIRENIKDKRCMDEIHRYLEEEKIEEMFEYLEMYENSLDDEEEAEKVEKLKRYFYNNAEGLIPYQKRVLNMPKHPEGMVYRNMGTMENHVWSVIAKRMKHNHTSWSIRGGNNLAKILAKKCSGRLNEVASKVKMPVFEGKVTECIVKEVLSAGRIQKKIGKGYEYPMKGKIPYLNQSQEGNLHQIWLEITGV